MKYVEYKRNGKIIYGWGEYTHNWGAPFTRWTLGPFSREVK